MSTDIMKIRNPLAYSDDEVRAAAISVLASVGSSREDIDAASGLLSHGTHNIRAGEREADLLRRVY